MRQSCRLNAVREICARTPLVMDATLLADLIAYTNDRNKAVAVCCCGVDVSRVTASRLCRRRDVVS
jgi:hypothetical protein